MKPSKDNPNGYWEDELIVGINDKLLASLGLYWYSLAWLAPSRLKQSAQYDALKEQAVNYLNELFAEHQKVALKDPRMCMLLPFWQDVFSDVDADIKVVLVKRNFVPTASSLVKRDHFDYEYASQMIFLHWASVVHFLSDSYKKILIQYEDVRRDEVQVRESLMTFCGVTSRVQQTLFEDSLEHHADDSIHDYGFSWQQNMLRHFPDAAVDVDRITALEPFYHALNVAYFQATHQRYVINEIKRIADNYKQKRVILYGASELASVVVGQLSDSIVLAVDYAALESQHITRYGLVFRSPEEIPMVEHDVILVGVTGRKTEVMNCLQRYSNKNIVFMETLLLQP